MKASIAIFSLTLLGHFSAFAEMQTTGCNYQVYRGNERFEAKVKVLAPPLANLSCPDAISVTEFSWNSGANRSSARTRTVDKPKVFRLLSIEDKKYCRYWTVEEIDWQGTVTHASVDCNLTDP